jgi:hypothetical protein
MKNEQKRAFAFACAVLFLSLTLQAEESCPVEVKLLLSPPTIQTAITSLSFEKQTRTRIYFFDTDALELFKQGVIVRLRQGADNDLTVKVRAPRGSGQVDNSHLRKHFPCEIGPETKKTPPMLSGANTRRRRYLKKAATFPTCSPGGKKDYYERREP